MLIRLSYGRGTLPVNLPPPFEVTVIKKPPAPRLQSPATAVRAALAAPIGLPPLLQFARGKESACILICDITRPVPNGLLLRPLIESLTTAGIKKDRITVLIATGMHRPNLGVDLEELVGDSWVLANVAVKNHDALCDQDHDDLGFTPHGTPIKLNRHFTRAEVKIVTGLVEPHFMAGYSGGRKVIAPGVAHRDTITTLHSHRFMADPCADNLILEGNPLHREQLAIAALLGPVFCINTVIDEHRHLSFVNAGELIKSHIDAVAVTRQSSRVLLPHRFSTVVTSAAGYPLDRTYYQAVKGMVAPLGVLATNGTLIIAAECAEGLGSRGYAAAQERLIALGAEAFLQTLAQKRFADTDEWQTQMQIRPMRAGTIKLYTTGLDDTALKMTGVGLAKSVEHAVAESVAKSGDYRIAVIPEGPYVIPACTNL